LIRVADAGAPSGRVDDPVESIRRAFDEVGGDVRNGIALGVSNVCRGIASFPQGFDEARSAAEVGSLIRGGPGVFTFEGLGPYKYVLSTEDGVRDRNQRALSDLAAYDRRRGTQLLQTLEGYLDGRGNVVGSSRALFIHPNTLRQRLTRIERITELDLEHEDWLSLAIAVKVVKLRLMRLVAREEGGKDD
jgi:DNA-binding PucR family transcriptional regulator